MNQSNLTLIKGTLDRMQQTIELARRGDRTTVFYQTLLDRLRTGPANVARFDRLSKRYRREMDRWGQLADAATAEHNRRAAALRAETAALRATA